MGKVAIYARVSTSDKQDYEYQITACQTAIGDKYGENDIEIFPEKLSGYTIKEKRPQLSKLLEIIDNDSTYFDKIYITEISRLGRDPITTRNVINEISLKKVPIFITSMNKTTLDDNGEIDGLMSIILTILLEFGNAEAKAFKARSKAGLLQSAKVKGNAGGGVYLPYGYAKDSTKQLVIDKTGEADVIKDIFNYYKNGNGCKKIAGFLNENEIKIPTRSNKAFSNKIMKNGFDKNSDDIIWSDKTINDIINNSIYKGDRRYKGEIIKAPAIISTELFDECNEIMKTKTHRNYLTTYTYLLKDLLVCGCCGRNYFAKFKPVANGDKVYICSSRLTKGGNCGNIGVNISLLETAIYNEIVNSKDILQYLGSKELSQGFESTIKTLEIQFKINKKQLVTIENQQDKLLLAYTKSKTMTIEKYDENNQNFINDYQLVADKLILIKKELIANKIALAKQSNVTATQQMLINARNDRTLLATLFKQFIGKVVINQQTNNNVLAALYPSINGVKQPIPLNLILDVSGIRKKPAQYNYKTYYIAQGEDEDVSDYYQRLEQTISTSTTKVITDNLILIEQAYPIKKV
jgi:site-specific DNA recombinase